MATAQLSLRMVPANMKLSEGECERKGPSSNPPVLSVHVRVYSVLVVVQIDDPYDVL